MLRSEHRYLFVSGKRNGGCVTNTPASNRSRRHPVVAGYDCLRRGFLYQMDAQSIRG